MAKDHRLNQIDINGVIKDLSHLTSFAHTYNFPAKNDHPTASFEVRIVFSDHCYTKGYPTESVSDRSHVVSEGIGANGKIEARVFDDSRYQDSLTLPNVVKTLHQRIYSFGRNDNFFTITVGSGKKRYVFFTASKYSSGKIILKIESVHDRVGQIEINKADFFVILSDASQGRIARPRPTRPEGPKKKPTKKQLQKKADRMKRRAEVQENK
jgi:hypothetical protein